MGPKSSVSVNYPFFAHKLSKKVASKNVKNFGILICGSGMGMAIAANKTKNIRAALCYKKNTKLSRLHNNANIITLGERLINKNKAISLINVFLSTKFEGGRHKRRVKKIIMSIVKANI